MKRFHAFRLLVCIGAFAFAVRPGVAQQIPGFTPGETAVVTLKSGDKFEGKVLRDAPDSVELEIKLTSSGNIKDKKVILKGDIAGVIKKRPSETEFAERGLGKLLPTPDLKDASFYESTIQDKLRTFVARYPGTPESTEVEKIIATMGEEKSKVVSGQLKMEGRWLDTATVKRENYNIEAYADYLQMKEKAAENKDTHYLEALRAFEKLRAERMISPYFLKAIPDALDYLKKYEVQIGDMIKEAPILIKRREDGLKQLPQNEQGPAKKAIDEEKRAYDDKVRKQTMDKAKWLDIYKYEDKADKGILGKTLTTIAKERADLSALDVNALAADSEIVITVIRNLADKNITEAGAAMDKAAKIQNPLYRPTIVSLAKELAVARELAKKEQKAAAAPASAGSTAAPEGDKSGNNTVAELLKRAELEKKRKAEEAAKAAEAKAQADAAKAQAEGDTPPPAASLMDKMNEYLPLIGGGLVVVIALAWLIGKRKKNQEEEA